MKLKILVFITIAAMSVIGPANARYYSGGDILPSCESESIKDNAYCAMYLGGIIDANSALYEWRDLAIKNYCIPEGVTLDQLRKVFTKYANENPQDLHQSAASMMMSAFYKAFPCE